jgi:hypothetical protein
VKITEPTILMPGLTARPTSRGFVSVDLGLEADPIAFTPDVIEQEKLRLGSRKDPDGTWKLSWKYRKEYLRDFEAQSGKPVFENEWLDAQQAGLMNPLYCMDLDESGKLVERAGGRLKVFVPPDAQPDDLPAGCSGVIRACGMGMDVSEGVSASDSTIQVFFADTWEQAAEFACNTISPVDLGRFAAEVGRYYNNALICCVRPMHGITTIRTILDECGYPYLWQNKIPTRFSERTAAEIGWTKGESSSPLLFGKWVDAVQYAKCKLHSVTTLDQHRQYIYDDNGRITHQALVHLPPEVRNRHGDLVVGAALAIRACIDQPQYARVIPPPEPPVHSVEWFRRQDQAQRAREQGW